jgi:hypothetical protein
MMEKSTKTFQVCFTPIAGSNACETSAADTPPSMGTFCWGVSRRQLSTGCGSCRPFHFTSSRSSRLLRNRVRDPRRLSLHEGENGLLIPHIYLCHSRGQRGKAGDDHASPFPHPR